MSTNFDVKKARILEQLEVPESEYTDLSPKGSIDEGIRELINQINAIPTVVTTSSCAGRVSIYLEGQRKSDSPNEATSESGIAGPGGKGGGRWLYVSHDPVDTTVLTQELTTLSSIYGMKVPKNKAVPNRPASRMIHFKFEAMILHMLTASTTDAAKILSAASTAGFRESGAMSLVPSKDGFITPMVAVRSNGLSLDSIIGYVSEAGEPISLVSDDHLQMLTDIANERFKVNTERIQRFQKELVAAFALLHSPKAAESKDGVAWEDAEMRRARKRAEGLARQEAVRRIQPVVEGQEELEDF